MEKILLTALFLLACSPAYSAVELDGDANGATDISKGGTNATTAANARTALGVAAALGADDNYVTDAEKTRIGDLEAADSVSFAGVTASGAGGLKAGTEGSVRGAITLYSNVNPYAVGINSAATPTGTWTLTLPPGAPPGANYLLNVDADGTGGFTDPATFEAALNAAGVVAKFASGSCSGYLKSDGGCDTPAGSAEVQDETFNATNFNGATTAGVSQDDFYDRFHLFDADDDGDFTDETWFPSTSGAPTNATYLTTSTETGLSAEANLGLLTTGLLKITVAAGVATPSTASAGTDYQAPLTNPVVQANLGTNVYTFLGTPTAANFFTAVTGEGAFAATLFGYADAAAVLAGIGAQAADADLTDLADGSLTGTKVGIADSGNYFTGTDAEAVLQELGAKLPTGVDGNRGLKATENTIDYSAEEAGYFVYTSKSGVPHYYGGTTDHTLLVSGGALGTPSGGTLTNATGLPIASGVSGLGTGVATALAVNTGSAGAPVLFNGAGGTPTSLNLTNAVTNTGTSLPGTCVQGTLFLDTDADTNGQLYSCVATNTWKDVDDDGSAGSGTPDDTPDNGDTTNPPTANWAYDHAAATATHGVAGAIVGTSDSATLTNKTLDVEGTGNAITIVDKVWFAAAGCNNATATSFYDLPTANAAAAACITGTNTQKGVLDFDAATDESGQVSLALPSDFTGAIDVKYKWLAAATSGDVVWGVQAICVADAETDDPSFNTASKMYNIARSCPDKCGHCAGR